MLSTIRRPSFTAPRRLLATLPTALALAAGAPNAILTGSVLAFAMTPTAHAQQEKKANLPIKRITLYRSGVASIERAGSVEGDATVPLRFQTDQINDILKSLVVLDLSGGSIGEVSYASREPLERRLQGLGINLADNPAMSEVLQRLRGTNVRLKTADGEFTGTVLNVETRATVYQGSAGGNTVQLNLPWINLLTETGIKSVNLTLAVGFDVLDPQIAADFTKALAAVAQQRSDKFKTVDVRLRGVGARDIVASYVHEAPVWKTSYRLVLPEDGEDAKKSNPILQGWAIVENVTDEDWSNIELALVSGNPVSFRMDLYQPLYLGRPMLPVPVAAGVMPKVYEEGMTARDKEVEGRKLVDMGRPMSPTAAAPAMDSAADAKNIARRGEMVAEKMSLRSQSGGGAQNPFQGGVSEYTSMEDMAQGVASSSGEVFQYLVDHPVTIEHQRSAMIPLISTRVEGRRITIVGMQGEPPMRGVEITNSTKLQLMPGPIAVYDEGTYAGDAQLGDTSKGARKLVAYAVDNHVSSEVVQDNTSVINKVRIVHGNLEITSLQRETVTFTLSNKDDEKPRTTIVEHARNFGWDLKQPAKAFEMTDDMYRFEVSVPVAKGSGPENSGKATLAVVQEHVMAQMLSMVDLDSVAFDSYFQTGKVSRPVREAFERMSQLKSVVVEAERGVQALEQERTEITNEQQRIRQNMTTIDRASELYTRLMRKLNDQETRLEAITEQMKTGRKSVDMARSQLETFVQNLDVE